MRRDPRASAPRPPWDQTNNLRVGRPTGRQHTQRTPVYWECHIRTEVLYDRLVKPPTKLAVLTQMCKFPRSEVLFKTKLSLMF